MSTETTESAPNEESMATKPQKEHEWLKNLLGEWRTETEMFMGPDHPAMKATGTESVSSLGGLWAYAEGNSSMPDGQAMKSYFGLGYDVSFKEYRGFYIMSVSSHVWKYTGKLSEDGKVMSLSCDGPDMEVDGKTANYLDVHELIDANHRKLLSYGEEKDGKRQMFMETHYYRV